MPWLDHIKVIAHRGASRKCTENTQSSILEALRQKADMIEVDVRASKDGKLIVFHDVSLNRLAKKRWRVHKTPWEKMKNLTLHKNERILTLEKFLQITKGKCKVNLEIKTPHYEFEIIQILKAEKMHNHVLISSKQLRVLRTIKSIAPTMPIAFIINYSHIRIKANIRSARMIGCEGIHPINLRATRKLIDYVHLLKMNVRPYSINNKQRMQQLLKSGADALFTDNPSDLHEVLQKLK